MKCVCSPASFTLNSLSRLTACVFNCSKFLLFRVVFSRSSVLDVRMIGTAAVTELDCYVVVAGGTAVVDPFEADISTLK